LTELQARQGRYRLCATPGCTTRIYTGGQLCGACYHASPEGIAEDNRHSRYLYGRRKEQARLAAGTPVPALHCSRCVHWENRCTMGFPDGIGTFAEDCAAFLLPMTMDNLLHPFHQDVVQDRLERAYDAAGRNDPAHPQHLLYTNVFGELDAKGIHLE
jgi:hypothetical protein